MNEEPKEIVKKGKKIKGYIIAVVRNWVQNIMRREKWRMKKKNEIPREVSEP